MPKFKQSDLPAAVMRLLNVDIGERDQLVSAFEAWPAENDAHNFSLAYLRKEYLSKNRFLDFGIDRKEAALTALKRSHENNLKTDKRLTETDGFNTAQVTRISRIQRKIQNLIGPYPSKRVFERCCWSGGATFGIPRRSATPANKMKVPVEVTARAKRYLIDLMLDDHLWIDEARSLGPIRPSDLVQVVRGNKLVFVPKNYKTERAITPEPAGNIFLQKGVGAMLRSFLLRVGIDLDDQSNNQSLARRALREGLATLDLKSASDSVTTALIYLLLPPEWAIFLDDLRSQDTRLPDGTWVHDKLFSSMGNGFTFELESLIFWAICSVEAEVAGVKGAVSVYGDDIIVPASISQDTIESLAFFGFQVNSSKSFTSGPFYESCGAHYYCGVDVQPVYQKEPVNDLASLVRFHNRLYRWQVRCGHELFTELLTSIRARYRGIRQPSSVEGDFGFLCPNDEFRRHVKRCNVHGQQFVKILTEKSGSRKELFVELAYAYWHRSRRFGSHELNTSMVAISQSSHVRWTWVTWHVGA